MTEHIYKQAPYQDVSKAKWHEALLSMPKEVHWELFATYEQEDRTTGSQEFACTANSCEIVDFPTPIAATQ
jgi:ribonucleoside-diphosphate reductase alpha chain